MIESLELGCAIWAAFGFDRDCGKAVWAFFGSRFCCRGRLLGCVDCPHHQKDHKGNNDEVNDILDKVAIGYFRTAYLEGETLKIDSTNDQTDERHNNIVHKRGDDFSECTADDHSNCQIDDVTAYGKIPKLF